MGRQCANSVTHKSYRKINFASPTAKFSTVGDVRVRQIRENLSVLILYSIGFFAHHFPLQKRAPIFLGDL